MIVVEDKILFLEWTRIQVLVSGVKIIGLENRARKSKLGPLAGKWAAATANLKIHPGWVSKPKIINFFW